MKHQISLLCLLFIFSFSANAELYIHQLKFVQANQVIPVIKPHIDNSASLTGKDFKLFANVSKKDNEKIQAMLQVLDKKLEQYRVEVKIKNRKLDNWELKATRIHVGSQSSRAHIKRYSNSQSNNSDKHFQIMVLSGQPGFVNTGESFQTHQLVQQYQQFVPKTGYRKTTSGFYVTVRPTGKNQVKLDISAQTQQRKKYSTSVASSATTTQVSGQTGEWILLATTGNHQSEQNNTTYSSQNRRNKRWYYARVTQVVN